MHAPSRIDVKQYCTPPVMQNIRKPRRKQLPKIVPAYAPVRIITLFEHCFSQEVTESYGDCVGASMGLQPWELRKRREVKRAKDRIDSFNGAAALGAAETAARTRGYLYRLHQHMPYATADGATAGSGMG